MTAEVIARARARIDSAKDELGEAHEGAVKALQAISSRYGRYFNHDFLAGMSAGLKMAMDVVQIAIEHHGDTIEDPADMGAAIGASISLVGLAAAALYEAQKGDGDA